MKYKTTFDYFAMRKNDAEFQEYLSNRLGSFVTCKLDFKIGHYDALFTLDYELSSLIYDLYVLDRALEDELDKLPRIARKQYIITSFIKEIENSDLIENVYSTRREITEMLVDPEFRNNAKSKSITNKYNLLLDDESPSPPTTIQDIRKLYDAIFTEVELGDDIPDGILFRTGPVQIRKDTNDPSIHRGLTGEEKISSALNKALKIYSDSTINPFIRIAVFHFLYEYIHLFYDGNSRSGRFITSLMFKKEFGSIFAFRVSAAIKNKRNTYYKSFERTEDVRNYGDLNTFIYPILSLFKDEYIASIEYVKNKFRDLRVLREYYDNTYEFVDKEMEIVDALIQASLFWGYGFRISNLAMSLQKSERTIARMIDNISSIIDIEKEKIGRMVFYSIPRKIIKEILSKLVPVRNN